MKIINRDSTYEIIVKKSRFIGLSYIVNSMDDINSILNEIKQNHKNAKHICYAYIFNNNNIIQEAYFESSEPSGSSGKQIYNLMKKLNLVNTLVVVVRYFGNIKLGVGLLSRSYLDASKNVLINSNIIEFIPRKEVIITFHPSKFQYVMNFIKENNILIKEENNSKQEFILLVPTNLNMEELLHYIS